MKRKRARSTSHEKDVLHFFQFLFPKINIFLHFGLGIDLTTLKMTLNPQDNSRPINRFSGQNPHVPSATC